MKRFFCCVVAFICVLSVGFGAAQAVTIEYDINYWYSDGDEVGVWANKTIDVYVGSNVNYSSLTYAKLKSYLSAAVTSWSCTGLKTNEVGSEESADLIFGAISRLEATSINIPTNLVGFTVPEVGSQIATLNYGTAQKRLYSIESAMAFLIASDATSTTTGAKKVAVHELGHAFGYFDHYANGAVMTSNYEDMTSTTPNTAEKNHLKQVK